MSHGFGDKGVFLGLGAWVSGNTQAETDKIPYTESPEARVVPRVSGRAGESPTAPPGFGVCGLGFRVQFKV